MSKKKKDELSLDELDDILGKGLGGEFNDPYEILFEDSGKKKKKKDREELDDYKESLKALSKKELRKKCEEMGVDLDYIDQNDKKAMRKAIMKSRKDQQTAKKMKSIPNPLVEVSKSEVPYYFDTDTHDFVIGKADDADDMLLFDAMRSLGDIRKQKRANDGFGGLMDAITKKLKDGTFDKKALNEAEKKKAEAIDVEYTEVKEEPKGTKDVAEEFSADVKEALSDLAGKKDSKKK